ncbi:hypothetical protein PY02_00210, partial [Staphylococcus aureus]
GVAGHGRLMGFRSLAAVIAVLDILLGIVPGAAARRHRNGDEQAGDDHAEQHRAHGREALGPVGDRGDDEVDRDRAEHRQQRRHDHFLDRRLGDDVDGAGIVRTAGAFHDARVALELVADVLDHRSGGAAHGSHAEGAE